MGYARTRIADKTKNTVAGIKKKYVRYDEGCELYSMGRTRFMKYAHEAHAVIKVDNICLVDTTLFEAFLDQFREYDSVK